MSSSEGVASFLDLLLILLLLFELPEENIFEKITGDDDKIDKIKDALEDKYDDKEKFKRAYLQALVKECSAIQVVSLEELQTLAKARSASIKSYLVDVKEIKNARIQELEIAEVAADDTKLIRSNLEVVVK